METVLGSSGEGAIEIIPIHFDVSDDYIPLKTFKQTAEQTEAIIANFNEQWFAGELEYEVLVIPPKPGTFLSLLAISVAAVGAAAWAFLHSEVGKAFIQGLSGEEPAHWAEKAGERIKARLTAANADSPTGKESVPSIEATDEPAVFEEDEAMVERLTSAMIVVESTKTFLKTDASELRRIGVQSEKFRDGYEARNKFYGACLEEKEIRAIGFDDTENFPISRKDFVRLQVALVPREEAPDTEAWKVETTILKVASPNWDREDAGRRWKGKDPNGRDRLFSVDDEHFWNLATAKELDPDIIDTIKVQWAYHGEGQQRRNARVLRVLEYNDDKLAEPLDTDALNAIVGRHERGPAHKDLFT